MQRDEERLADVCMAAVRTATAPLLARIQALEQRQPRDGRDGEKGEPGKDADASEIIQLKAELDALRSDVIATKAVPDSASVREVVVQEVTAAIAALPPAKDGAPGKDADESTLRDVQAALSDVRLDIESVKALTHEDRLLGLVKSEIESMPPAKDGAPGPPGESIDMDAVDALVASHVTKAFSDLTLPKDGTSVTVEDVKPLILAEVTKAFEAMPKPKDGSPGRDGISVVSAIVGRDGHLVQTFSDGATKDVGPVVGKDADPDVMARMVAEEVAKIPRPKDGRDGSLENLKAVQVDDRTIRLCFKDGTPVEGGELVFGHPLDRGVWRETGTYGKGDGVSFGGSFFIAQRDDPGKPEVGDGWRLAVKRGRDGQAGKDLTQKVK